MDLRLDPYDLKDQYRREGTPLVDPQFVTFDMFLPKVQEVITLVGSATYSPFLRDVLKTIKPL